MNESRGTLGEKEPHPAIESAKRYLFSLNFQEWYKYLEAFSSCAIEGNRFAEVCAETLNRLLNKQGVSDRYFLGLVWAIRDLKESDNQSLQLTSGKSPAGN